VDALSYLINYSKKSDKYLKTFFKEKKRLGGKIDSIIVDSLDVLEDYAEGGKKLRGALTILGYQIGGGRDLEAILPVSCGIELLHNFLLVHDDVIDRDKKRRGKATIHEFYSRKNGKHFGISKAIVMGDIGAFLGYELIVNSEFSKERIVKAISSLNDFLLKTIYGEMLDVEFDLRKKVSWEEILKVRTYKTAFYTFVMPLKVGAILGGANSKTLKVIEEYGIPVGLAFQLADDILGVFGNPEKTGKSNENDIRDGKKTFLFAKTLELTKDKDRRLLLKWYGSSKLDKVKTNKIRKIIRDCHSLDYSYRLSEEMILRGKKFIPKMTGDEKLQDTLTSLTDFTIERKF
jgi:geranylgeranyl diphosphate synthase type I